MSHSTSRRMWPGRDRRRSWRWSRGFGAAAGSVVAIGLVAALAGCAFGEPANAEVRDFVDETVSLMNRGINANSNDWHSARDDALPDLLAMPSVSDTYAGLSELAVAAGGNHSHLLTPSQVEAMNTPYADGVDFPKPTVETSAEISVITLPAFNGQSQQSMDAYQDIGIAAVRDAVAMTGCGWIIDLRSNGGGNTYPMLSTIAPLLRDGKIMGFEDRDGDTYWLSAENGNLQEAPDGVTPGVANFRVEQPVAIVTSRSTASSAEVVVVAFAGQPDTIRVGSPTTGLTTGNETFDLSDGGLLVLSTSRYVDRDGTAYDGPIQPDLSATPSNALETARDWVDGACG